MEICDVKSMKEDQSLSVKKEVILIAISPKSDGKNEQRVD